MNSLNSLIVEQLRPVYNKYVSDKMDRVSITMQNGVLICSNTKGNITEQVEKNYGEENNG